MELMSRTQSPYVVERVLRGIAPYAGRFTSWAGEFALAPLTAARTARRRFTNRTVFDVPLDDKTSLRAACGAGGVVGALAAAGEILYAVRSFSDGNYVPGAVTVAMNALVVAYEFGRRHETGMERAALVEARGSAEEAKDSEPPM